MTAKATGRYVDASRLLCLVFLCLFPLAVIVQGIDFTDMGFNLANQRLLLSHPESYVHGYLFYLSNLIGGVWLAVSEPFGLFGARFGWVVLVAACALAAYRALVQVTPAAIALFGLCVALVWTNRFGVVWIDYNHVAGLFGTLAACALVRFPGTRGAALAGAFVACAALARLPSLALLGLGLVTVLPSRESDAVSSRALRAVMFAAGFVAAALALLAMMAALGHIDFYVAALEQRFNAGVENPEYDYSASSLAAGLASDYSKLAVWTLPVLALAALLVVASRASSALRVVVMVVLTVAVGMLVRVESAVVVAALVAGGLRLWLPGIAPGAAPESLVRMLDVANAALVGALIASALPQFWTWLIPAAVLVALVAAVALNARHDVRRLCVAAIVLMLMTPLGSGNGLANFVFGFWLAAPMTLWALWYGFEGTRPEIVVAGRNFALSFFVALFAVALVNVWNAPYRDIPERAALRYVPNASFIDTGRTNEARAAVVDDLMSALAGRIDAGDELLIHGSCPLLHVITETRPVMGVTWPAVYSSAVFDRHLRRLAQRSGALPPVLLSAGSCRAAVWPYQALMTTGERVGRERLSAFMKDKGYQAVWRNSFFSFWTAN